MDHLRFTLPEMLSLVGVAQCVYILVYVVLRADRISSTAVPLLYFFVLATAFLLDFASGHIGALIPHYEILQWAAWFYGPPLSVLLIVQVAQVTRPPAFKYYGLLLLVPLSYIGTRAFSHNTEPLSDLLIVAGLIAGAVSLLAIWAHKDLLTALRAQRGARERYWLVLSLVFMNVFFLGVMLAGLGSSFSAPESVLARTVLGLSFVYLANTSVFRIFPQAVRIRPGQGQDTPLSAQELEIALKIEKLINLEKVYQEAAYARADLARECNVSEAQLSKIINAYFKKSFPQLINENRVEDAKALLAETEAPVHVIAAETGFNALASFNRVFKEVVGVSPSDYRARRRG
jgi:AraC-like DNA-binding protein